MPVSGGGGWGERGGITPYFIEDNAAVAVPLVEPLQAAAVIGARPQVEQVLAPCMLPRATDPGFPMHLPSASSHRLCYTSSSPAAAGAARGGGGGGGVR